MRTITLELLRHGPAHNQLLSPLTPYLALCENHGAVTINMPFEHNQLLHRLDALGYRSGEEARIFQLKDTAAVLGELLGLIPGLTAETNKHDLATEPLTHLRLIISASELALLPFELALSPAGLPGAGQFLLLQPQMPICLTREVRRALDDELKWPDCPPRILFVAAAPPEVGSIPLEAHLLALRRAIDPWMKYYDPDDAAARAEKIAKHLVFLPDASIEAIEKECATCHFTHVHILAHGIQIPDGRYDKRYALALHDARDPDRMDPISGTRLATALRASGRDGHEGLARPAMVTLASCNSADVGSVAGAGASIAHALHEAGIAMVVAGQFPLSFEASIRLVEVLYEELLWGTDPRTLIDDVRRRLYSQFSTTHDWASLATYLSLPRDFEQQLSRIKIEQARRSVDAAMNHADVLTRGISRLLAGKANSGTRKKSAPEKKQSKADFDELFESAKKRMSSAAKRLEALVKAIPENKAEICGYLASAEKRRAEVLYHASVRGGSSAKAKAARLEESKALLVKARDYYWESYLKDRASHWAIVQYLSLDRIITHTRNLMDVVDTANRPLGRDPKALWTLARVQSLNDLYLDSAQTRSWAHGNLIELYLLALLPDFQSLLPEGEAERRAKQHTEQLLEIAGWKSFEVYSTRRQIARYLEWYNGMVPKYFGHLVKVAHEIFDYFPSEVENQF